MLLYKPLQLLGGKENINKTGGSITTEGKGKRCRSLEEGAMPSPASGTGGTKQSPTHDLHGGPEGDRAEEKPVGTCISPTCRVSPH